MKARHFGILLLAGLITGMCGCLPYFRANKDRVGPVYDQAVGRLEGEILGQYGYPDETYISRAGDMGDELRYVLRTLVPTEDTPIKEFYYRRQGRERIFWLTEQPDHAWRVVSDVDIPPGTKF